MMEKFYKKSTLFVVLSISIPLYFLGQDIGEPKFKKRLNFDIEFDLFDAIAVDFFGDTMFYFSLNNAQKYAFVEDYSFFVIDLKKKNFKQYHFKLRKDVRSRIIGAKSAFHDIAVTKNKVYILYTGFILALKYDAKSDSYKLDDLFELYSPFYYFYYIGNGLFICNRLSYYSNGPDAELLLYDIENGEIRKKLEFEPFPGSHLVQFNSSQWISHNRKYTVVSYLDEYSLKLYNHDFELIDHKNADSLMFKNKNKICKDSIDVYYNKENIINNRSIVDTIPIIRKISFVNDSLLMVIRSDKQSFKNGQIFIDYWLIKDGILELLRSNFKIHFSVRSPTLSKEIISKENLPIGTIISSSPVIIHKKQLIILGSHQKNKKSASDFIGTSTYEDYIKYSESKEDSKKNLSLIFFYLF